MKNTLKKSSVTAMAASIKKNVLYNFANIAAFNQTLVECEYFRANGL